ncbi:MAG: DUF4954 family protein [Bacteroidetes bacterium]|nr:DUF4954 family protein [Bacteroidota bacterium]
MNQINKSPINSLGYQFVEDKYLPVGMDEYYLRNEQNKNPIPYRGLTAYEIETLVRNRNSSDDWNQIFVSEAFTPELVVNCKFFGLVRIGKLEPYYLEFHNLRCPVGLYNSTIISSDLGDNISVDNVNYLSHYIIGNDVIIVNVNELATTDNAKFGNGILKDGEPEHRRIWLELRNENAGRSILPFDGMLPGDAYLWSSFRDDEILQKKFKEFTEKKFDSRRGCYGKIGDRTVIKNCRIIKDCMIGTDAYLKGANKIKNVTLNSAADSKSQIGEGCEIVNGIIGYGCRIFYGVKAVRFIMASHSQLKYGARLINSYLGNNSTISCCEVLNSLIFPAHEQHHNNSFLCAALLMGQSNMAAGATIGSNHNSRSADGEIVAGRGFWPGLCVSLKHNSKFASFIIVAKGDYSSELNIPMPFSLVSNHPSKDELIVMPAYWFLYNMYALARNSWKSADRDKRIEKIQQIEYDFLAPDSINEMIHALELMAKFTGQAYLKIQEKKKKHTEADIIAIGKKLLDTKDPIVDDLEIIAEGFENSNRKTKLIKVPKAYPLFKEMIIYHAASQMVEFFNQEPYPGLKEAQKAMPTTGGIVEWVNIGGQLIKKMELEKLIKQIHTSKINDWDQIHGFYKKEGGQAARARLQHALSAMKKVHGIDCKKASKASIKNILLNSIATKEWMTKHIYQSRAKDYANPFRQMVYENRAEMDTVIGKLDDNSFINLQKEEAKKYKTSVNRLIKKLEL